MWTIKAGKSVKLFYNPEDRVLYAGINNLKKIVELFLDGENNVLYIEPWDNVIFKTDSGKEIKYPDRCLICGPLGYEGGTLYYKPQDHNPKERLKIRIEFLGIPIKPISQEILKTLRLPS